MSRISLRSERYLLKAETLPSIKKNSQRNNFYLNSIKQVEVNPRMSDSKSTCEGLILLNKVFHVIHKPHQITAPP